MKKYLQFVFLSLFALMLTGCPRPTGTAQVTALLTTDAQPGKNVLAAIVETKQGPVDIGDIQSLQLTLNEISLDRDVSGSGEDSKEVIFTGTLDIDLLNLIGVSDVLTEAEVPAGDYTKVRLSVSNPRLVLEDAPAVVITDVHLTANGHVFVSKQFTLPAGQPNLIILDFGGIHLVEQGNGGFTLTPQLDAQINVSSAEAVVEGEIIAVDIEAGTITIALADGSVLVLLHTAPIFLPTDTDTATGTTADLILGLHVHIEGLYNANGTVDAVVIHILA